MTPTERLRYGKGGEQSALAIGEAVRRIRHGEDDAAKRRLETLERIVTIAGERLDIAREIVSENPEAGIRF